ncbi:Las1-domain-containing protein [Zopfia rhizophila CBS 207.26]|uniref:Las1-domain-containing protein n=1 Tax=Zopfia rhizophila CBS 207.26 TaxID=1314779 RepID=A0A6A6EHD4_9PEZI|nr:Las1-domain-containing protein [Zopfia rhizophila CBS 207.26]
MSTPFTVTLWRDEGDLAEVRRKMYRLGEFEEDDRREDAVNQILAWRTRKRKHEMPLALDSTVDLVDSIIQEEKHMIPHSSLRLLYAGALTRFVTGFSDTQAKLIRHGREFNLGMDYGARSQDLPVSLVKTRHNIVHRSLPSLVELRGAAQRSVDWLWHFYWEKLDKPLFKYPHGSIQQHQNLAAIKQGLRTTVKTYLRDRRPEVKELVRSHGAKDASGKESKAGDTAARECVRICQGRLVKLDLLAEILVDEENVIPSDKKVGSKMDGAFLIWDYLLRKLSYHQWDFLQVLINRMTSFLNAPSGFWITADPVREAMYQWVLHILTSDEWAQPRKKNPQKKLLGNMMAQCFTVPTAWNLKLAEALLKDKITQKDGGIFHRTWYPLLEASLRSTKDRVDVVMNDAASPPPVVTTFSRVGQQSEETPENSDRTARLQAWQGKLQSPTLVPAPTEEGSVSNALTRFSKSNGWQKWQGMWKRQPIGSLPLGWESDK